MKVCSVDGCGKTMRARGLCSTHYNKEHQPNRHPRVASLCTYCSAPVTKGASQVHRYRPFCNLLCRDMWRMETGIGCSLGEIKSLKVAIPPNHPVRQLIAQMDRVLLPDQRSALRRSVEDEDPIGVLAAIGAASRPTPSGCWEWQRKSKDGYPVVNLGGRSFLVHRLSLEAYLGKPLGKQPAHHKCANTMCVNPAHLQAVTARENAAEMLARRYMESRIRDLEAALRLHEPAHPLLAEVGIDHAA